MPLSLKNSDITRKATKNELKRWVRHHVPVRGDRILWGRALTGDMRRRGGAQAVGGGGGPGAPGLATSPDRRGGGLEEHRMLARGETGG